MPAQAVSAEPPVEDDEITSHRGNVVLVAQRRRQAPDQVKKARHGRAQYGRCAGCNAATSSARRRVVALVEQGIERVEDGLNVMVLVARFGWCGHGISPQDNCLGCICRPLFERCTRHFLGNVPKSGSRCRVSRLRHDQCARRRSSQFAKSSRSVISAWLCLRARRREQDRPGAIRCGMTEQWSRETARKRNKTARTAREQVGSGKSRMGHVTDQLPARRVAPPLQFKREHQACELRLPVCLPRRIHPRALQITEIDGARFGAPGC